MEGKLAILIKSIAEGEQHIEESRKKLFESISGDAEIAFKILDRFSRGTISVKEIGDFLKSHNAPANDEEIQLVLDNYDQSGNRVLSLRDFTNAITPEINKQVKPPKIDANHKEIEQALLDFIMTEVEFVKNSLFLKKPLIEEKLTTAHDFYKLVDKEEKGITHTILADFVEKQGIFLTNQDLIAFFRRVDRENQKRITYREFKNYVLNESVYDKKLLSNMFSEKKIVTIGNDDFNYDAKKVFLGSAQSYNHSLASTTLSSGFKSTTQNFYSQNLSSQNFTPQNFTTQNFNSQNLTSENRTRSMSNSHVRSLSNSNVRSVSNSHVRSPSYSKVQSPSYSNIQSPMLSTYDSGKQSYLMRESFVSKKDPITQFAKFKEDSWANYSRAYPYYFGRLPDYQLPSYYDYYPYNHHLPSTRFYRLFDDYENAYHCVPYVPPYTYYKAYRDLVHEPYYSSFLYYRSRDYYGPYVYHSPYTGNLYPLRYSRYHYPELLARPTYFYRHELLKEDLHPYSKDYFIPYYRPRFYYRVYPRQPSYYYLSSTGKRFYLGDDYINYYAKPVLEYRNEKPKKNYFDDNMFNYDIKPSTRKYYPTRYQYNNKVKVPYPNTKLYNSDAIRWKYSTLSYKK